MTNTQIEIITGRKGEGKSSLAYHRARLARRGVVIFDPNGQFAIGTLVHSGPELLAVLDDPEGERTIVFRPEGTVKDGFRQFFEAIWTRRDVAVIVDEVSLLGSTQFIDENLDKLIRLGRTKNFAILLTAHRPQDLHGIIFSLADSFDFFFTTHPNDLKRIENFTSEAARERVTQLRKHQFLHWDVEADNFYVTTDSETWREEISAPELTEPDFEQEEESTANG